MSASHPVAAEPAEDADPLWTRMRLEASEARHEDPEVGRFLYENILGKSSLESAVVYRISEQLTNDDVTGATIRRAYVEALRDQPGIREAMRADIAAVMDRDPATTRWIEPVLYYKGFHAIQTHRLAHWLYSVGRRDFALYLQSRSSAVFQCDIHPAAPFGRGVFLDHATGFVVGETAVVDDDVSILHGVTLGGTGKDKGDRHPKIRRGVLISAGAKVLGNIEIGPCARVAAGSVVLKAVPAEATVAGVPAKVVGYASCGHPSRTMDQLLSETELDV